MLFRRYGWALGGRERDPEEARAVIDEAILEVVTAYDTNILTRRVGGCLYNMIVSLLTPKIRAGAALLAREVDRDIPELSIGSTEEEAIEEEERRTRRDRDEKRKEATRKLKPIERKIFELRAEGLKSPEIARRLGLTPVQVRRMEMRARLALKGEKRS